MPVGLQKPLNTGVKKDKVVTMSKIFAQRNRKYDITGVLVFNGENFMQVLDGPRRAIVRAIVECCYSLGISVIAEGVEEEAEVKWLLEPGVSKFQGFYFSRTTFNCFPDINW